MRTKRTPRIRKSTGELQTFDASKLRSSLRQSGADDATIEEVVSRVVPELEDGTTTQALYRRAWRMLTRRSQGVAARYSLKSALLELGPAGYRFENYVGLLLEAQGWSTKVGVQRRGRFVDHEIDVIARRANVEQLYECKFRNRAQGKVDIKVALYIYGRAVDLDALREARGFGLATNAVFTSDAVDFGSGMGLHLLSWNYPEHAGLKDLIPALGLEPVTVLSSLKKAEQRRLLDRGTLLIRDLMKKRGALSALQLEPARERKLQREIAAIEEARESNSRASS